MERPRRDKPFRWNPGWKYWGMSEYDIRYTRVVSHDTGVKILPPKVREKLQEAKERVVRAFRGSKAIQLGENHGNIVSFRSQGEPTQKAA